MDARWNEEHLGADSSLPNQILGFRSYFLSELDLFFSPYNLSAFDNGIKLPYPDLWYNEEHLDANTLSLKGSSWF